MGWTPAWLEAVVAALDMTPDTLGEHLQAVHAIALRAQAPLLIPAARCWRTSDTS